MFFFSSPSRHLLLRQEITWLALWGGHVLSQSRKKGNTNGYFSRSWPFSRSLGPWTPTRAVKLVDRLDVISPSWRFWLAIWCLFPSVCPPPHKWEKSLLVSMRINPKACGDIPDYKLTAYKCQAGSHGCDGATSSRRAVNIQHDVIERLSGDNELNLFAQLLYIDGLPPPQVIKVTFQLERPPKPYHSIFLLTVGSALSGWHFQQFPQTNDRNYLLSEVVSIS